jgi:hypothetical protein
MDIVMHRRSLLAFLAFAGTACTTLHPQPGLPADALGAAPPPDRVTLMLHNGSRLDVWQPIIRGDSIVGYSHPAGDARRAARGEATTNVQSLSIRKISVASSVMLIVGIAGVAFALTRLPSPKFEPVY